ncbi:hypothetical protein EDD98_6146 [Streptomyces sp. PanSC19]|nr:hypothetical protein EDD98_6146 [Streptomyces sp. PanSC19]
MVISLITPATGGSAGSVSFHARRPARVRRACLLAHSRRRHELNSPCKGPVASHRHCSSWFTRRKNETFAHPAAEFGVSTATAWRYVDGTLIPTDRIAADEPYHSPKHKRHGMNVQVMTNPLPPAAGIACTARIHPPPDPCPDTRDRRRTRRRRTEVLRGQGASGRWTPSPGTLPEPPSQAVTAAAQQLPRQDPPPRRAGHGHCEGLATPTEAPPQHEPDHRRGEVRSRPSPHPNLRLEKAQCPNRCPRLLPPGSTVTGRREGPSRSPNGSRTDGQSVQTDLVSTAGSPVRTRRPSDPWPPARVRPPSRAAPHP